MITRDQLLEMLRASVEPDPRVHAMWLGGSFAFGADDELSDLDAVVVVEDDSIEELFEHIEASIAALAPIAVRHRIPEPAWHGFSQCFYRLASMREEHLLDLCLVPRSKANSFNEEELHGQPVVLFDRSACQQTVSLDRDQNAAAIEKRRAAIAERHELFGHFVAKELARGDLLAAHHWFQSMIASPLIELLRMKHCPERYGFGARYLRRDLPDDVREELESLVLGDPSTLLERTERARAWIRDLIRV